MGARREVGSYFRIPTFLVLCGQGMFGAIPWNALSFTTLFYQLSGFSDLEARAFCREAGRVGGGLQAESTCTVI